MQHNERSEKPNKLTRFLKEKGYYIVLSLCILAVGISGYVFVSGAVQQNQSVQESLSVPTTVEDPGREDPAAKRQPIQTPGRQKDAAQASAPVEETAETAVPTPAVRPVGGDVTQDYAMDRLTYNATTQDWRVHNGVDLAAEVGQTVAAAQSGTVSAVYEDENYGTTVVIRHADGYTTHYCNLAQETAVSAGDTVSAGDAIGTIGATALLEVSQAPHLHFEVYKDGTPTDPAEFLP